MKLVRVIKMCLNETYSRVRVDEHMSDMFPIKNVLRQGDALVPLLCNFAINYAIRRVQVKQDGLKLSGTHQLVVYADDVNILGRSVHTGTVKKKTQALVVASKETGLEVNADKTKYMVMSQDQNAEQSQNLKTDNSSFVRVKQFKYLGTTLMNQNSIQEKIKIRLKSENGCYHSAKNLLSFSLLTKSAKIKIYRTIILPVAFYGCETWLQPLSEKCRQRVLENRVLRRTFRPNEEFSDLTSSPNFIWVMKLRRMKWVGHVARMEERRGAYGVLVGKPEEKGPLGRPKCRCEDNIKMDL